MTWLALITYIFIMSIIEHRLNSQYKKLETITDMIGLMSNHLKTQNDCINRQEQTIDDLIIQLNSNTRDLSEITKALNEISNEVFNHEILQKKSNATMQ